MWSQAEAHRERPGANLADGWEGLDDSIKHDG